MRKVLVVAILALLFTGCNKELTVSEVNIKKVNSRMQEIIRDHANENGNYLISTKKEQYVFLNRINVVQGDEAIVLRDFAFDVKQGVLTLDFSQEYTTDYSNKNVKHQMLYNIKGKGDYDTIQLTSDGESLFFHSIIVN